MKCAEISLSRLPAGKGRKARFHKANLKRICQNATKTIEPPIFAALKIMGLTLKLNL